MRLYLAIVVSFIIMFTGCTPTASIDTPSADIPALIQEGAVCLPYSPEGKVVFDSEWTGVYPEVENYEGTYETVTFGMGCFWGPAAKYSVIEGVLRTRVGYSGGNLSEPNYDNLGNHIEIFEVDYDPTVVSYESLVKSYFELYDATMRPFSQRVKPVIYYRTEDERLIANSVKSSIEANSKEGIFAFVEPFEIFYLAEPKHQLSFLKQETSLFSEVQEIFQDDDQLLLSILASRLNGYVYGYGDEVDLEALLSQSGLSDPSQQRVRDIYQSHHAPKD